MTQNFKYRNNEVHKGYYIPKVSCFRCHISGYTSNILKLHPKKYFCALSLSNINSHF